LIEQVLVGATSASLVGQTGSASWAEVTLRAPVLFVSGLDLAGWAVETSIALASHRGQTSGQTVAASSAWGAVSSLFTLLSGSECASCAWVWVSSSLWAVVTNWALTEVTIRVKSRWPLRNCLGQTEETSRTVTIGRGQTLAGAHTAWWAIQTVVSLDITTKHWVEVTWLALLASLGA
jgi:hypothetical protein